MNTPARSPYVPTQSLRNLALERPLGDDASDACPSCSCLSGYMISFLFGALGIFMLQEAVRSVPTVMKATAR